jgi:hypothetical protein
MSQTKKLPKTYLAFYQGFVDKMNGLPYKNPYKKDSKKAYSNGYKSAPKIT